MISTTRHRGGEKAAQYRSGRPARAVSPPIASAAGGSDRSTARQPRCATNCEGQRNKGQGASASSQTSRPARSSHGVVPIRSEQAEEAHDPIASPPDPGSRWARPSSADAGMAWIRKAISTPVRRPRALRSAIRHQDTIRWVAHHAVEFHLPPKSARRAWSCRRASSDKGSCARGVSSIAAHRAAGEDLADRARRWG